MRTLGIHELFTKTNTLSDMATTKKRTTKRKTLPADSNVAYELVAYVQGTPRLNKQLVGLFYQNLKKKREKGVYDHAKAVKLMRKLVDRAIPGYKKEYGFTEQYSAATKDLAAKRLRDYLYNDMRLKNIKKNVVKK